MSMICLLCDENETPEGHNKICDTCYDNAGNYLEQNVGLIRGLPYFIEGLREIAEADEDCYGFTATMKAVANTALAKGKADLYSTKTL